MKIGFPPFIRSFGLVLLSAVFQGRFIAHAFEPEFKNATLQVGNVTLSPTEVTSPWRQCYLVGSNLFYVSENTVQHPAAVRHGPAWSNHSDGGASLNCLTASANVAYFQGYRLGPDGRFIGYDSPARVRRLDLHTGKWLPDLSIRDGTPAGSETTNVLAALANDQGVFVLTSLTRKGGALEHFK